MATALEHIDEKLNRAKEHIDQLEFAVNAFLDEAPQRKLIDYDPQSAEAFKQLHSQRVVPPRLSVITGDVFYQLRSSLDHVTCALILKDGGTPDNSSQFPITWKEPSEQHELRRYQRQIEGITRPEVLTAIEDLQPWKRTENHWLSTFKGLSNTDKHRQLILHVIAVEPRISYDTYWPEIDFKGSSFGFDDGTEVSTGTQEIFGDVVEIMNVQRSLSTYVAFAQWPGAPREVELINGLRSLRTAIRRIVGDLARFL
jgi:hypothetical protein